MNTSKPVLFTVLGLALLTGLAIAATTSTPPPPAAVPAPPPPGPPEAIRDRIADKLGLSAEQQKAVAALRARQHAEMMALLTPAQQEKAGEMRGQMKERIHRFAQGPRPGGRDDRRGPAMQPMPKAPANPLEIVAMGERIKDRIAEKLQLTDEQRDKLDHLGRAYRTAQRDAAKRHREEMRAVLNPEQQQKFEEMQRQHSRRGPQGGHPPFVGMNDGPEDDDAGELPPPPEAES